MCTIQKADAFHNALDLVVNEKLKRQVLESSNPGAALALAGRFKGPVTVTTEKERQALELYNEWFDAGIMIQFHPDSSLKSSSGTNSGLLASASMRTSNSPLVTILAEKRSSMECYEGADMISCNQLEAAFEMMCNECKNPRILGDMQSVRSILARDNYKNTPSLAPLLVSLRAGAMEEGYCSKEGGTAGYLTNALLRETWYNMMLSVIKDEKKVFGALLRDMLYYCVCGLSE